ncbi:FAD-binding protein [Rhodovulum adriaticum]|uniref:FAD-binding protein n=1 Tax=Rhodovulum adriaticum TaxID=35804 RepID=UPI001053F5FE|nr:FAD-binding protein [Rhodovulum adriaticum]MBK1636819.1 2-hydroxy-acid oxidase [Rhodovulum adriaticum]
MRPETEAALAEAVASADGPLRIVGGGTRSVGAPVEGAALSLAGLSGVELYEPGALTLVVRAGTPVAEVEEVLAGEGQRLAFEPMDHRALLGTEGAPTMGGVVAGNISGPRRIQVGACRDALLGVRFVDGRGQVLRNGGRVMKNVTGYDLVKLMAGSRGTLGVLSEVAMKVLPTPEAVATLTLHGAGREGAFDAMTRAMKSPFEVSGAAWVPGAGAVHLRLEGFAGSVAYRADRLIALLSDLGEVAVETGAEANAALWRAIRDVEALADLPYVWRVSMAPGALRAGIRGDLDRTARFERLYDWAGGLCWIGMSAEQAAEYAPLYGADDAVSGAVRFHRDLQGAMADPEFGGGHATLVKAPQEVRAQVSVFQPDPAPLDALARGLRAQFDPRGILNPGLMG